MVLYCYSFYVVIVLLCPCNSFSTLQELYITLLLLLRELESLERL
jgi:hypothetical protein